MEESWCNMTNREEEIRDNLQDIAKKVKEMLPEGMGFTILAYEFGEENPEKKMLYVSNSNRKDVIWAMTEFIKTNVDNPEIWGKDV